MILFTRLQELRSATGSLSDLRRKASDAWRTVHTLLDAQERNDRYARLQAAGQAGPRPTDWQLMLGASHMMMGYILPSNVEFYEAYELPHWWSQLIRVLDEPSAMMDPIGLAISRDMVISHLVQVVHSSAGYDVALLMMFDDGIDELKRQLQLLCAGEHPRQEALDAIVERPEYHQRLLAAVERFEADPVREWRVDTFEAPEGCHELYDWGIETFGSPARLFEYCRRLPETPSATAAAWFRGQVAIPTPSTLPLAQSS